MKQMTDEAFVTSYNLVSRRLGGRTREYISREDLVDFVAAALQDQHRLAFATNNETVAWLIQGLVDSGYVDRQGKVLRYPDQVTVPVQGRKESSYIASGPIMASAAAIVFSPQP